MEFAKPCIMKTPAPTGAIKVQYWDLITDKKTNNYHLYKKRKRLEQASHGRANKLSRRHGCGNLKSNYYYETYHRLEPLAVKFAAQDVPLDPQWLESGLRWIIFSMQNHHR
jgi:hypothetical protein